MKKIEVNIVFETEKAKLVEFEGKKAWVQNRSYKDGLVNSSVFVNSSKTFEIVEKAKIEDRRELTDEEIKKMLFKETEKAYCFKIEADFYNIEKDFCAYIWLPKSWKINIATIQKKAKEYFDERFSNAGGYSLSI